MFNKEIKSVSLVGVGPGDEKLLTLRACECIETADVIVYDNLINPTILNRVKIMQNLFMQVRYQETIILHRIK